MIEYLGMLMVLVAANVMMAAVLHPLPDLQDKRSPTNKDGKKSSDPYPQTNSSKKVSSSFVIL